MNTDNCREHAVNFSLRLEPNVMQKLRRIAHYERRSLNKQIVFLLRRHIEEYERVNGEIAYNKAEKPRE